VQNIDFLSFKMPVFVMNARLKGVQQGAYKNVPVIPETN
jgi:hypothetical protein